MKEPGVESTTSFRIVRQVVDHIYGADEEVSPSDFIELYGRYAKGGGSWEKLMDGDMGCVKILEDVLEDFIQNRRLHKIAQKIVLK